MKKTIISALRLTLGMGLTLFISCTEDLGDSRKDISASSDNLAFSISTENIENARNRTVATRGSQANTASLDAGFGVSCSAYPAAGSYTSYGHGSYFYKVMAVPNIPTAYYWPTADYKVSFFAYYPYGNTAFTVQSPASAPGTPTYAYTVPSDIESQVDIMTAERTDIPCSTHTIVALSFAHRCTDIRFTAYNQQSDALTVKSIAIYGVRYSGTYTSGASWTLSGSVNSSTSHPFLLSLNTAVASKATVDLTGTSNHFIMLPQTVASGTDFLVIKTQEDGEERTYTYTLDADYELVMGKSVTFQLILGNGTLTINPVSVVDWQAQ